MPEYRYIYCKLYAASGWDAGLGFFSEGRLKLTRFGRKRSGLKDKGVLGDAGQHMVSARRGSTLKRAMRLLTAVFVCFGIVTIAGIVLAYYMLQGRSDQGSALLTRIETSVEKALGPNFDVTIGAGETDLSRLGRVTFNAQDIVVKDANNRVVAGSIKTLELDADWLGYLSGEGAFDGIKISGVTVDTTTLFKQGPAALPPHLDRAVNGFGRFLNEIYVTFERNELKSLQFADIQIEGPLLGRISQKPLQIPSVAFTRDENNQIVAGGKISTEHSTIDISSSYSRLESENSTYEFRLSGINLREWSVDPNSDERFVAADGLANLSGSFEFDANGQAQDPVFQLASSGGMLRLGKRERSDISQLELNLKVFLDKNQIELERSFVGVGGFSGVLIGGLKPVDAAVGYAGDIQYDLIVERGEYTDQDTDEAPVPGAFQAAGVFAPSSKMVDVKKLIFTTAEGAVTGSAKIGLEGETPSLQSELSTDGIQIRALKQFWPFFVAGAARNWVLGHIHDGWVEKGTVFADIPAGILFKLPEGRKLKPEHYRTNFTVKDFSFRPFGNMPRIEQAMGEVLLEGMKIEAKLDSGKAKDSKGKSINIRKASFLMRDFADENRTGETTLELDGDIKTIARISDRKPLRVMERMKVSADQFSGKGHADVVAKFPVGRKISYNEVEWNVLLQLENGSSSKSMEGRTLSKADLLIDASPIGAKVSGTAAIDGVKSRIEIVQPIGKSGKVKPKRKIVATLDEKDRKKLGFDLAPVVKGPISISIERSAGKETHNLDFKNAEIALPWIGWSKGKGIATKGRFDLVQSKGTYVLKNFVLAGAGFESTGELVLNKNGLLSADLSKVKLNERDDIRLKIERKKDTYNINATGLSYDTRSIINTLIHSGGFSKAQGGRSVNLVANFETVRGFNNRIMRNAILLYESRNGQLTRLDMTANGSDGRKYSVQAQLNGNETLFSMATNDAGNALAFTDIYTRMEGGNLSANLVQSQNGPYIGPVTVKDFNLVNEPKLARLASNVKSQIPTERGEARKVLPDAGDKTIKFQLAAAQIERGKGYLNINDAIIRSGTMGFTATGNVYDPKDRMSLKGTFMPANGVNLAVSAIPILGKLLSNGKDNALIGIAYRLSGQRKNPKLEVNPLSLVTPGVFNKVFEFR